MAGDQAVERQLDQQKRWQSLEQPDQHGSRSALAKKLVDGVGPGENRSCRGHDLDRPRTIGVTQPQTGQLGGCQ